jgi:hypothetical protein
VCDLTYSQGPSLASRLLSDLLIVLLILSRLLRGLLTPLCIVTLIVVVLTLLLLLSRCLLLRIANTSDSLLDGQILILVGELRHHDLLFNLLLCVAHFVEDTALLSAVVVLLLGSLLALGHGQSLLNRRIVVVLLRVVSAH